MQPPGLVGISNVGARPAIVVALSTTSSVVSRVNFTKVAKLHSLGRSTNGIHGTHESTVVSGLVLSPQRPYCLCALPTTITIPIERVATNVLASLIISIAVVASKSIQELRIIEPLVATPHADHGSLCRGKSWQDRVSE